MKRTHVDGLDCLLRYDRIDKACPITLRRASRMHHLAIGPKNTNKNYWRNQNKEPGRWPSPKN